MANKNISTEYKIQISVYYAFGSVFNSSLTANTKKNLEQSKKDFIERVKSETYLGPKLKVIPSVEAIVFYGFSKIVTDCSGQSLNENIQFAKKIKNSYYSKR